MTKQTHIYYLPNTEGLRKAEVLWAKVIELGNLIDEFEDEETKTPFPHMVGYPFSQARTKLEECCQQATQAIVRKNPREKGITEIPVTSG